MKFVEEDEFYATTNGIPHNQVACSLENKVDLSDDSLIHAFGQNDQRSLAVGNLRRHQFPLDAGAEVVTGDAQLESRFYPRCKPADDPVFQLEIVSVEVVHDESVERQVDVLRLK